MMMMSVFRPHVAYKYVSRHLYRALVCLIIYIDRRFLDCIIWFIHLVPTAACEWSILFGQDCLEGRHE